MPANAWTHLAATYNGSTQRLYVNGALVGSRAQTGAILALRVVLFGSVVIQYGGAYFKGYIDEVRVYNRELSQAEISADSRPAVVGLVSTSSSRSNPVPLNGLPISGSVYVSYNLISPTASSNPATEVTFWLDDPNPNSPTGTPRRIDYRQSFRSRWKQQRWHRKPATSGLTGGVHTVTARGNR